jgi:hypothetical protein
MKKLYLILLLLAAPAAQAAMIEPMRGTFTEAQLQAARQQSVTAPQPSQPGWEDTEQMRLDQEHFDRAITLNSTDDDATHYARGQTMIIHVFVSHNGGTWDATERGDAGAKAAVAKDFYLLETPADANLHFDHEGTNAYYYYSVDLNINIPDSGMTGDLTETCLATLGVNDGDADGLLIDDFSINLQNWDGGWDNVIICFEADQTGRAWASYGAARCALYTDDTGNVFAHEWGHLFGACDEYVEGGECNGGINCGACQSWYLDDTINNGNCQLASCPSDVSCLMINNTFTNICNYTLNHWGWVDEDSDGILDWVKRRTTGNNFVNIYEIPHNGYALWNNTTDGYVINQQWNSWSAAGLRSPAGADYDLKMYGDNNHNFLLASSAAGGQTIDIIASDYNHDRLSNEHLIVNRFSGNTDNYRLQWESGTGLLYPDGVARAGSWQGYYVVRCWDVPLYGGESVSFTLDVTSGNLDLGMALFKSNGDAYHVGRSSAQWVRDAAGVGATETWTYNVPSDDVYGFVVFANSAVDGQYTIKIGPTVVALAEESPFYSAVDLRLYEYTPNAASWSIVGTRPDAGQNVGVRLFSDSEFQNELANSDSYGPGAIEFDVADYNGLIYNTDFVRVVNHTATGNHRTEWEQDNDLITGVVNESWTSPHVGKIWDAYMNGDDNYFVREYHSGSLDTGIYMFSSTDGDRYKDRNSYAGASNFHPAADGGEWFTIGSTVADWYGLAQIVNDETSGSYSIWFGPKLNLAQDASHRRTEEVVFGTANVNSTYWTVFGVRPYNGDNASVWLYGDDAYTITSLKASDQDAGKVNFIVADFNHIPTGNFYPRFRRTLGTQGFDVEWEGGSELLTWTPGVNQMIDRTWPTHDVIEVFDLYVTAGHTVQMKVEDLSGGSNMNLGIALFKSNGAEYYATLGSAVASADVNGVGGSETMTYTFPATDYYGFVIYTSGDVDGDATYRIRLIDPATASVEGTIPTQLDLTSVTANPFTQGSSLRYALPQAGTVDLGIYDVAGRRLKTLVQEGRPAGSFAADWDGRDDGGNPVPSGIYFARLRAGVEEKRLKLVRSQ